MKTRLILATAFTAMAVYSCSPDRSEEEIPSSKIELHTIKNNKEAGKKGTDTVRIVDSVKSDPNPGTPTYQNLDGGDPKDGGIVPPKR